MVVDKGNNFDHSMEYTQMVKAVKKAKPDFN
jgi:hypothetical protein